MLKFALAGNPNCGKTTLFNSLTGSTAHVGNWPGVTVDKKEGLYKKCAEPISIIDLPGIYSLSPYTPEEVISRNYILDENPDCVINIIDATNLERNLYLTTQIMEIDVPMIIALNMMDAVEKSGSVIDANKLEKSIGIPVVPISALKEKGLDELMNRAYESAKKGRQSSTVLSGTALMHLIGDCKIALEGQGVDNSLFHAIKLVEMDEIEVAAHPTSAKMVEEFKKTFKDNIFGTDFEAVVADARYKYIAKNYSVVLSKPVADSNEKVSKSDKADKVLTHKIWGIPIFLVILFAVFHLTFSEDLLYLGAIFDLPSLESLEMSEGLSVFVGLFYDGAVFSPGIILTNILSLLTDTLSGLIAGIFVEGSWYYGLINDGIVAGVFAVIGFLPQILTLFLFFSILEDSGYMARVAFILDRIFRRFGLSGRAFMPMIMGFGCSLPAMINTRTLADEREKVATIRVIPFFSCGAKLPILTAIAGGIISRFGVGNADVITYGFYLLGIIVAIATILLMRATTMRGEVSPFIMELPTYHAPGFRNLMLHLWDKTKHFVKKAFTIILASTIVIWFLQSFGWNWNMVDNIEDSILASIGQFIQPLFTPLGFGAQLGNFGWVFAVAAITGLLAKEVVISTFFSLAAIVMSAAVTGGLSGDVLLALQEAIAVGEATEDGVAEVVAMIYATGITIPGLLSFVAFNMLTIPCFAAVATAKAELPSKKSFNMTILFWIVTSFVVASMIYVIGSWWWTAFIFAAVWAVIIAIIVNNNKKRDLKEANVINK